MLEKGNDEITGHNFKETIRLKSYESTWMKIVTYSGNFFKTIEDLVLYTGTLSNFEIQEVLLGRSVVFLMSG